MLTLGVQVAGAGIGLFVAVIAARSLGPAGAGIVQLAQTLGNQLALVLSLGVTVSLVRAVALDPLSAKPFSAALLLLVLLVPAFALLAWLAPLIARAVVDGGAAERTAIVLAFPLGWLFLAQDMAVAALRGRNWYRRVAFFQLGGRAAVAGALVLTLVWVERTAAAAVVAMVAANACVAATFVMSGTRWFGVSRRDALRTARQLVRFNTQGHVGTILQEISYRFDLFLVAGLVSTAAAGVYSVAGVMCTLLWYVPTAGGTVLLSRLPGASSAARHRALVAASQATFTVMLGIAVIALIAAPVMVPALFGERFRAAVPVFVVLLPGAVLLSVWKVVANGLAGLGYPSMKLPSAAGGALTGVVLDLILIPRYGIRGAAVAASIAYSVTTLWLLRSAASVVGVSAHALLRPDLRRAVELLFLGFRGVR